MNKSRLLFIDAAINIVLGLLLLLLLPFPEQIPQILGVPQVAHAFYPSILGAVLFGIGIALLLERYRDESQQFVGLGLGGAIVINLCGGIILMGWLVFGDLSIPLRGMIFLWLIAVFLIVISGIELYAYMRKL